jgi:hypothetical protein
MAMQETWREARQGQARLAMFQSAFKRLTKSICLATLLREGEKTWQFLQAKWFPHLFCHRACGRLAAL